MKREKFSFDFTKNDKTITIEDFPDVISSVERINRLYPNNQIIVVDADSPDQSYQERIKEIDPTIIIENIKNRNFEPKGIIYVFKKYRHYFRYFFFLQDSILLRESLLEEINNQKMVIGILCSSLIAVGATEAL